MPQAGHHETTGLLMTYFILILLLISLWVLYSGLFFKHNRHSSLWAEQQRKHVSQGGCIQRIQNRHGHLVWGSPVLTYYILYNLGA